MKFLVLFACISMQTYMASSRHVLQTCSIARTPKAFSTCLKDMVDSLKPDLIKGTSEYNWKPFQPFEVKEHSFHQTIPGVVDLKGAFTDLQILAFDQLQVTGFTFDPKSHRGGASFFLPYFTLKTKYTIEGNVLGNNIKDSGSIEINTNNVAVKSTTDYKLVKKEGKSYIQLENVGLQFLVPSGNAKVVSSDPELQALGDKITDVFALNPQAVLSPLYHMFGEIGNEFAKKLMNDLLSNIPADEIIPNQFL